MEHHSNHRQQNQLSLHRGHTGTGHPGRKEKTL